MRLRLASLLTLIALAAVAFAQETNFASGPQYLITGNSSPLLLQSIATPTLSLGEAPAAPNGSAETAPSAEPAALPALSLSNVFWGDHTPAEAEARRIETPGASLAQVATPTIEELNQTGLQASAPTEMPTSATQPSTVIQISSTEVPGSVPASIFNPGVTGTADTQSLLNHGYGIPLAELAAYWKSYKRPASRVITNEDLERMRK